jgi:hypothetical protein
MSGDTLNYVPDRVDMCAWFCVGDDKGNEIYMVGTPPMVFVDDMVQRENPNAKLPFLVAELRLPKLLLK